MRFQLTGTISGALTGASLDEALASFNVVGSLGNVRVLLGGRDITEASTVTPFRTDVGVDPPGEIVECFEALSRDRLVRAADLSSDDDAWLRTRIDGDRIRPGFIVPIRFLPARFGEFVVPLEAALRESVFRVVRIVRWSYGLPGLADPIVITGRLWSLDDASWRQLPYEQPKPSRPYLTPEPLANVEEVAAVQRLLDTGVDEPIGRLLWLVSSSNRYREPRAALAMAAAAAEVAMRSALKTRVSRNRLRSLDVRQLLSEVMALAVAVSVTTGLPLVAPPSSTRDRIVRTAGQRNALVHGGVFSLRTGEMDELLDAAENLLWILDYLAGYRAALRRVNADVLTAMGKMSGITAGELLRSVSA